MRRYFDTVIIGLGILSLAFGCYLIWERRSPATVVFAREISSGTGNTSPQPEKVEIPALALTLPVYPARVVNNKWETTKNGISYAVDSPHPGEKGNSIFFGHNWPNLLGNLKKLKPGDTIRVTAGSGTVHTYTVSYTAVVSPADTRISTDAADARLTIYTCAGFMDAKRLVVTAILSK